MPLHISIEPGGHKWRSLALDKLRQLKEFMAQFHLPALTRWYAPDASTKIWVNSCLGMDKVRIFAGGLAYYALVPVPVEEYPALTQEHEVLDGLSPGEGDNDSAYSLTSQLRWTANGIIYGALTGTEVGTPTGAGTLEDPARMVDVMTNFPNGGAGSTAVINGELVTGIPGGGVFSNTRVATPIENLAVYIAAIAGYTADKVAFDSAQTAIIISALAGGSMPTGWAALVESSKPSESTLDGEVVTLIPFGPVKDGVDLGILGDRAGAQEVAIYGRARFRSDTGGGFTFLSWAYGDFDTSGSLVVAMQDASGEIPWPDENCVVKYTRFEAVGAIAAAEAQTASLVSPITADDRFIKLVTDAV